MKVYVTQYVIIISAVAYSLRKKLQKREQTFQINDRANMHYCEQLSLKIHDQIRMYAVREHEMSIDCHITRNDRRRYLEVLRIKL